jgi:uncharacterized protein
MTLPAVVARTALKGLIQAYRWFVSPMLGVNCRFAPSCSEYALEAVTRHGALRGSALAARRLCRCHPWGGDGFDPVPTIFSLPRRKAGEGGVGVSSPPPALRDNPLPASPVFRRGRSKIVCDSAR